MTPLPQLGRDEFVDVVVQVAERDPSIARILREICGLDGAVRASALDLVGAHLRIRSAAGDVLDCVAVLKGDEVARRIAERLGPA